MAIVESTIDSPELALALVDPKSVFYRRHTESKAHRYAPDAYFYDRGLVMRTLDRRHETHSDDCFRCNPKPSSWEEESYCSTQPEVEEV